MEGTMFSHIIYTKVIYIKHLSIPERSPAEKMLCNIRQAPIDCINGNKLVGQSIGL